MTEKPFKIGDIIEGDSYSGVVENITLRTIKIRTDDNSVINVPNLKITTECVTNISEIDNRRFNLPVYISYGIKIEKVKRVMDKIKLIIGVLLSDVPAPLWLITFDTIPSGFTRTATSLVIVIIVITLNILVSLSIMFTSLNHSKNNRYPPSIII